MALPPTVTYLASFRSLLPLQSGHKVFPLYRLNITRYWILYILLSKYLKKPLSPLKYLLPVHISLICSLLNS